MIKLVMLFRYKAFRYIAMLPAACLLSGCLGGTVAQQLVRTIATSVADKSMARAMGVEENEEYTEAQYAAAEKLSAENTAVQRAALGASTQNATTGVTRRAAKPTATEVDDITYAMATFSFKPVEPIAEPLPEATAEVETRIAIVQGNQLVHVELFNLLLGEEKNAVYENARLMGSTSLPPKREWQNWQVGVGEIEHSKKVITFLIPPEFGKLPSGAKALVELAGPGEPNIARYEPSNLRLKQASGINKQQNLSKN
jgi:hypothetical protein